MDRTYRKDVDLPEDPCSAWHQRLLPLMLAASLSSCMSATPDLHVVNGETYMSLTQSAPISRGADISPDGKYLLTGGMGSFSYWDISKGMQISRYSAELPQLMGTYLTTGVIPVAFASGGKYALSGGEKLLLWDLSSGKVIRTFGDVPANSIGVSSDGRTVLACEESEWAFREDKLDVYDVNSGNITRQWNAGNSGALLALSPGGRYAMSTGGGARKSEEVDRGLIILWDVASGRRIHALAGTGTNKGLGHAVLAMAFSANERYALSGGTDGSVRLWDVATGAELRSIQAHSGWVGTKAVAFSPDGKTFVSVGGSDGLAKLWDLNTGSMIKSFKVSDDRFAAIRRFGGIVSGWVAFTPDSKRIIYMGSDASFRIFDAAAGTEVATLVQFDDGEWLVVTSEGYYNASRNGAQHLEVTYAGRKYGVDQFYDVFYRPDIVAAKLSGLDISGLVSITMKDASSNPPPSVEFTTTLSDTDRPKIKVCYRATNTGGGIGEVRLFHNGKLIESDGYYRDLAKATPEVTPLIALNSRGIYNDMRNLMLKEKDVASPLTAVSKGDVFDDCREVDTVPGENEISVAAFNKNNTVQSHVNTISFNAKVRMEEPHLYILSIGIDKYKDPSVTLEYAVKDAKDIEASLVKQSATIYRPDRIHYEVLKDDEATKTNIRNRIDAISQKIKPADSFILFAAGHGVFLQNQYYVVTHDYDGTLDSGDLVSSNEIVEMSKKIKSLNQLYIFDTCNAGGVDYIVSGLYDARMSVLAKKMGLHIYASASDKQSALDGYQGNGLFTYTLLDGLNNKHEADRDHDRKVSLTELGEYSRQTTIDISRRIGHQQTPLIVNFGKDNPVYDLR